MLIINGTDYGLPVIAAVSVVVLFLLQYALCGKTRSLPLKLLPTAYILLSFVFAGMCLAAPDTGFIDLRGAAALLFCGYGAICSVAVSAAWLVYKYKLKKS